MFPDLITDLQQAKLPSQSMLKKQLHLALIKKNGVVKLPYLFWTSDPKINPPTKHLLWAAILLEDKAAFLQVVNIALIERNESDKSNTDQTMVDELDLEPVITPLVDELLDLAPDDIFRKILAEKASCVMTLP